MKTAKMATMAILVTSLSTSAFAGSYGKNKRTFKRAKKIDAKTFESKILGKTFKCEGYFSDNTSGSEFYQFIKVDGKIINNLDKNSYTLSPNLIATESRMGGEINVHFRITRNGELVAHQDSGWTSQYIHCPASQISESKPAKLESILEQEVEAVAATDSGTKILLTTDKVTLGNGQTEHKDYIKVISKDGEVVLTQSAEAFLGKLGMDYDFNGFPPDPELTQYKGEFYINGSFYNKNYGSKYMTLKFDESLTNPTVVVIDQSGELKINPENGELSFYGFDSENRGATKVVTYTNDGKLISTSSFEEMRLSSGFEGATLTDGSLVIASYCDNDYNELYGCPERGINYAGVSLVSAEDKKLKFFTGPGELEMTEPTIIKALKGGEFLVGYKGYNNIITLVRYNSNGDIINSYGLDAESVENNAIAIMPDHQKERINISNDGEVIFSQGNRVYTFNLN